MSDTATTETLGFQTEVAKLLHLMIHSLYSNKEIFLRELVSNAADASDKLRFESLAHPELLAEDPELGIWIDFDADAHTITLRDNGIGMSRDEVISNLGTIARSGTAEFVKNLSGDQQKDSHLIGQFGVGFYSAFVVAKQVDVRTRRAGLAASEGVFWSSQGEGEFSVGTIERAQRGTEIVLHLRDEATEYADAWRLRGIIHKYAEHIGIPVYMIKAQDDEAKADQEVTWEAINQAAALWTRPRTEISDDEYKAFYKHISHDFSDPATWSHNKVEGKLEYTSLLYIPTRAPFDLFNREAPKGLKLYVQRVFIMDDAEQFLPLYLRFVKGVIDSNDLPLNVSREILQSNPSIETIRSTLTKRVLDMLSKMAESHPEGYQSFWDTFGAVLKEGVVEDHGNQEKLASLFRFASSRQSDDKQTLSLDTYISQMPADQKAIYYVTAESFQAGRLSPHMEIFRKKDIDVLVMTDRVDEWMMSWLREYQGKSFVHVGKGDLSLDDDSSEDKKKAQETQEAEHGDLLKRLKDALGEQITEAKVSSRLVDSPACLVVPEGDIGLATRQMLEAAGQKLPPSKPRLEVNLEHALIKRMEVEADDNRFKALATVLYGQAALAEGMQLKDPSEFVGQLNHLLGQLFG